MCSQLIEHQLMVGLSANGQLRKLIVCRNLKSKSEVGGRSLLTSKVLLFRNISKHCCCEPEIYSDSKHGTYAI